MKGRQACPMSRRRPWSGVDGGCGPHRNRGRLAAEGRFAKAGEAPVASASRRVGGRTAQGSEALGRRVEVAGLMDGPSNSWRCGDSRLRLEGVPGPVLGILGAAPGMDRVGQRKRRSWAPDEAPVLYVVIEGGKA